MSSGSKQHELMLGSESEDDNQSMASQSEDDEKDEEVLQSNDKEEDDENSESENQEEIRNDGIEQKRNVGSEEVDANAFRKVGGDLKTSILNQLKNKFKAREGKFLCIRFPYRLPANTAEVIETLKQFCNRITRVQRMRQKYSRQCLAIFENSADRAKGMKELGKAKINGKKLVISVPKQETPEFFDKLVDIRLKKITERRAKNKLRKTLKKKALKPHIRTSTIIVKNIPQSSQLSEIRQLFPGAVEVLMKFARDNQGTSTATVTMPTPEKARAMVFKRKLKIGDNKLKMALAKTEKQAPNENPINIKDNKSENNTEPVKSLNSKQKPKNVKDENFGEKVVADISSKNKTKPPKSFKTKQNPKNIKGKKFEKNIELVAKMNSKKRPATEDVNKHNIKAKSDLSKKPSPHKQNAKQNPNKNTTFKKKKFNKDKNDMQNAKAVPSTKKNVLTKQMKPQKPLKNKKFIKETL